MCSTLINNQTIIENQMWSEKRKRSVISWSQIFDYAKKARHPDVSRAVIRGARLIGLFRF